MEENTTSVGRDSPAFNWKKHGYWIIGVGIIIIGLMVFAGGKTGGWSSYPASSVSDLVVDPKGQVWIASWHGSEIFPTGGDPIPVPFPSGLDDKRIFSLAIDEQDQIYVGSSAGVVGIRDINGKWFFYTPEDPELASNVYGIGVDRRRRVWIQTANGLGCLDPAESDSGYDYQFPGFLSEDVDDLTIDGDGQVWVFQGNQLRSLNADDKWIDVSLPDNFWQFGGTEEVMIRPSGIQFDPQGDPWVISPTGIFHRQGEGWIFYGWDDYIAVSAFSVDKQGQVWGGTSENGIFQFEPGEDLVYFTSRSSGLKHNDIDHIIIDGEGRIWIDTFSGMSILNPEELSMRSSASNAVLGYQVIPIAVLVFIVIGLFVYIKSRPDLQAVMDWNQVTLGFIGWFVINGLYWAVVGGAAGELMYLVMLCVFVPLPANIIILLVLLRSRRWMAIGAFSAMAINSILVLLNSSISDTYSTPFLNLLFQMPFFLSEMLGF